MRGDGGSSSSGGGERVKARSGEDKETERLPSILRAQLWLRKHRDRPSRQSSSDAKPAAGGEKGQSRPRVSPIAEELKSASSIDGTLNSPKDIGSADSSKTVRGSAMPFTPGHAARTPSYPFPSMNTPNDMATAFHRPFTALSPTVGPATGTAATPAESKGGTISGADTPGSALTFLPPGAAGPQELVHYPSPNLYETTLMLGSEPGLDPWWTGVVQLSRDYFKAERVTLSVPADTTDPENVPWGLKATFNTTEEDTNSLAYLRPSSLELSSEDSEKANVDWSGSQLSTDSISTSRSAPIRPVLLGRHSFSGFEAKQQPLSTPTAGAASKRPGMRRAESHLPTSSTPSGAHSQLNFESLRHQDANQRSYSSPLSDRLFRGRVVPVLQALDYEADPLIDSAGVTKVLERGRMVILSRQYSDLERPQGETNLDRARLAPVTSQEMEGQSGDPSASSRPLLSSSGKLPSKGRISKQGRSGEEMKHGLGPSTRPTSRMTSELKSPGYEDYERMPASPWSQSPAPSPAVRAETAENPFFVGAKVDEESFNPETAPEDYSVHQQVEAIGVDKANTVIHLPLIHPLLSRATQRDTFGSGNTASSKTPAKDSVNVRRGSNVDVASNEKKTAIAILSILSPVVPFPSNLAHSLHHLAPHLATSFSLARHFTTMETEAAGLSRRRPRPAKAMSSVFGPGAGQQLEDLESFDVAYSPATDDSLAAPLNLSTSSPSEHSVGSPLGSLVGTPGREAGSVGAVNERGHSTTASASDVIDSYFQWRRKSARGASGNVAPSITSSPLVQRRPSTPEEGSSQVGVEQSTTTHEPTSVPSAQGPPIRVGQLSQPKSPGSTPRERSPSSRQTEDVAVRGREVMPEKSAAVSRSHPLLPSYGADFNATFQSLPAATTSISNTLMSARTHTRSNSETWSPQFVMPPPSERLLRTIVDAIPVHIFTAAPQSGAITWVNSRFLIYRGQTVEDFMKDPWQSIHPDQREDYLKVWRQSLKNGEHFSYQVRVRRFDGNYRWFYVRAAPLRDTRGITVHWFGTTMDIHEQHVAEASAAKQQETAASEAKYRSLANSSPQVVFAATDSDGVTFANTQWLSYSGQKFDDALGLGFMDHVHAEDLAKCKLPFLGTGSEDVSNLAPSASTVPKRAASPESATGQSENTSSTGATVTERRRRLSRTSSSASSSTSGTAPELSELAKAGVLKMSKDSDGKISYSTEVRLRSKEGDYRWHLVRCIMVDSVSLGGGEGSWFGTCTDINDHKLLEQTMKETMDSKTRFLSNMSHEIRTPLIGISGMVEFLFDTILNAEQSDYCNTIKSSSDGLLSIVNDILDLSKIEAGMMSLSHEWFHIRSLIESVNDAVSSVAINKRLELNYVVEEDVPAVIKGDRARIRQILMNVLGNAVKFTTKGEVFAHCELSKDHSTPLGEGEVILSFKVVDSGPGFSEKEAELIFKPFSQIDGSSTRQYGGSGLGLVISRQLVELHGGVMTGTSEPGQGSTFTFSAKFHVQTEKDNPAEPAPISQHSSISSISRMAARSPIRQAHVPFLAKKFTQSPAGSGPLSDRGEDSPGVASSGSSDPSIMSARTGPSERSSISSILPEAATSNETMVQDAATMKLVLPSDESGRTSQVPSPSNTPTPASLQKQPSTSSVRPSMLRPPLYSILIVCPQPYSLQAITKHIEMTLPKDIPHQIMARRSLMECQRMIGGDDPVIFTHIVVNLGEANEVVAFVDQILDSMALPHTSILILADTKMRNGIKKQASGLDYAQLEQSSRLRFLHKPTKPSRFAENFDPLRERESSRDRNRSSAELQADRQKRVFVDMEKDMGHKGYRVLLVEDNLVNQKASHRIQV